MPFRDKMKRAFGKPGDEEFSLTQVSSKASRKEKKPKREYPDNVYKPGEAMPRPKYRAAYNKEHQDKLSAFSFGNAWKRRESDQSQYSPMGSRLPSISLRRLSFGPGQRSRKQSYVTGRVDENTEGDDDVGNVGLSKQATRDENHRPRTAESEQMKGLETCRTVRTEQLHDSDMGMPFTEEELTLALSQTTLKAPLDESS